MFKRSLLFAVLSLTLLLAATAPALAQANGYLKAKVNTGRAGVFIDGKYVGPAANFGIARKYTVAAGEHEVKLVEPRYEEYVTKVQVAPGKVTVISQNLTALPLAKPPFGRLRIQGPEKYSAVYLNGKYMGHVDEFDNFAQGLLLNPGEYNLKVVSLAGSVHEEKVKIETDKTTRIKIS